MKLVLFGVSSPYAAEAWESAARAGIEVAASVVNRPQLAVPDELGARVELQGLTADLVSLPFLVPLVSPGHRYQAAVEAGTAGFSSSITLVDPTAVVAQSASFGAGSFVNAGAIIGAGVRAGRACSINRGASLGHHNLLADYVTIGPRSVTGGSCRIGRGVFVGIGAVVAPEVSIGPAAVVGAGAVVLDDVPSGAVVVGNPARQINHANGYGGIAVPEEN